MNQTSFDLFDLLRIILVNRKLIIGIVLVVAIGAVAYSLLTPEIWSSQTSFFAVGDDVTDIPFDIPGFSGLPADLLGTDSGEKAENFITVMLSRTISEEVIRKYKLIDYFKLDNPDSLRNMDDALKKLRSNMVKFSVNKNTGLITIIVQSKSKQLSLDIVNYYLKRLDEYNRTQKVTQGKLNREFLEERVKETRMILDSLIVVNQTFQEKNKAVDLEAQAKSMIESYGVLIAEKMKLDIELELARSKYSANSPILIDLDLKKKGLDTQIKALENSGNAPKPEYLLDIDRIPAISSQYAQIKMNMEVYKTIYEFLYPQYEAARLTELKDMPTLEILDQPRLAGRRDKPKRALICAVATVLAFFAAVVIALLKEAIVKNKHRIKITGNGI
ncbi:MAG: Wzz/FepE/Etk N-terminal domain-containing protein [Candidatus Cloacimonetes bacterium]|jgi:uncharacterized protein involved in exopolysaccharide biosynthesis|nr:hypothetical protein [Candidatus Cloacimonadota bacterium]MDY0299546.1 Wzz/FepE/Etk N-terminal domain-containing protein [Candidatus Cloacimonadaceae bacterium]MCB5278555.1 hypothetical protein [Candidatus Cloacimonadota bacterium]MCK9333286.1 Wzz/FepE/Etk N-terminal domain-containing protein [Candidatus Cloacimonadota bacterium]MDD2210220.1 Wzz/FepE/Etk N-terminal domain-containing protein [Candidatus Cloacimonadota bacterium]